jgi:2,3-bisphosphoglycerate-dependent phosphoglycerate mutase
VRPARLVLVRHAESARNVIKKGNVFFADDESRASLRGVADHQVPLTEEGRRQATVTGEALRDAGERFDLVVHSGYRRTVETMEGILAAFPVPAARRLDVFVRERDAGHAFDMTTAEVGVAFPWLNEYWQTTGPFFARPPGGESVAQVCERVRLFLDELGHSQAGRHVLVVTHGITLRAFRFLLEGWTYDQAAEHLRADRAPRNASVTIYEDDGARLALRAYDAVYY